MKKRTPAAKPKATGLPKMVEKANALFRSGKPAEAEAVCENVLESAPEHVDALILLGVLKGQSGDFERSIALLDRAMALQPRNQETRQIRSLFAGRYAQARANEVLSLHQHGTSEHALGRLDAALASYEQALRINPEFAEAHNNRGNALQALGRFEEALSSYDQALRINPDYAEAYCNRGSGLQKLKRLHEALASYDDALRIKPDFAEAHSNRGVALQELSRYDEALQSFDQALRIHPGYAEAHYNRGATLQMMRRVQEALASYAEALRINPGYGDCRFNRSLCLLQQGDHAEGWREHEWRWKSTKYTGKQRHVDHPLWLGSQSIAGKAILLWFEQGYGDTLQFCRYASAVAGLGATVYLEVPKPLKSLLTGLEGVRRVFSDGDALPEYDCHCPLLSLPHVFKANAETISGAPYLSTPAPKPWVREVLNGLKPKIGIAWSGNANQENDHNRSMPFLRFQALLPRGLEIVCLQKDIREADRAALAGHAAIRSVAGHLKDFSATAALINELDLVITVDTSIAHLAGAMGKEVWILLSWAADWRWLMDRADSPWYDSATLFRQSAIGHWDNVLADVRRRLCERFAFD